MAHRLDRHLGIGVGRAAGRKQSLLAEPALAAADRERHHHAVADLEVRHLRAERHNLAHILMAQNVSALHGRLIAIEQVEIRSADRAGRDLDDGIARMLDLGIGNGVYPNVTFSMPT